MLIMITTFSGFRTHPRTGGRLYGECSFTGEGTTLGVAVQNASESAKGLGWENLTWLSSRPVVAK